MVGRKPKRQCKVPNLPSERAIPSPSESQPSEHLQTRSSTSASTTELHPLNPANPTDNFDIPSSTFGPNQSSTHTDSAEGRLFDFLDDESWTSEGGGNPSSIDNGWSFPPITTFEIEGFQISSDMQQATVTVEQPSSMITPFSQPPAFSSTTAHFLMAPRSPDPQTGTGSVANRQDWTQFGHVVALCEMVRLLETQTHAQPTAVDEVMRLNQACIRDVSRISSKSEYMRCRSCPALISTIMELIVTRYEDVTRDQGHGRTSVIASSRPCAPSLQFGVFELDPDEQTLIRNRIICKEAQRCVKIIRTLKQLLVNKVATGNDMSSQANALRNWYNGMEKRMTDLIASLIPTGVTI
jgi:hypothetical protein